MSCCVCAMVCVCMRQYVDPPSPRSHQDYVAAMEDFQQSLELKRNQPIAMLYKGLTFFHRGMLKVRKRLGSSLFSCCAKI